MGSRNNNLEKKDCDGACKTGTVGIINGERENNLTDHERKAAETLQRAKSLNPRPDVYLGTATRQPFMAELAWICTSALRSCRCAFVLEGAA